MSAIPVYVVAFNNVTHVRHMVTCLLACGIAKDVRVVDNASTCPKLQEFLDGIAASRSEVTVQRMVRNYGHTVCQTAVTDKPPVYVVTDPDLHFNPSMPSNVLDVLLDVAEKLNANRVGLALDISEPRKFRASRHCPGRRSVAQFEAIYWGNPIPNAAGLELYDAAIDTTFALYRNGGEGRHIRVAGGFTCQHLPWYRVEYLPPGAPAVPQEEQDAYDAVATLSSTASREWRLYRKRVERHGRRFSLTVRANMPRSVEFLDLAFHHGWHEDTFGVLRAHLVPGKAFVDIGSWIGPMAFYAAQIASKVFCVEADATAAECLWDGIRVNELTNVEVIERALSATAGTTVRFGVNEHRAIATFGDSTSQVLHGVSAWDPTRSDAVPSITVEELEAAHVFDDAALVKVDIEGGEQDVLPALFEVCCRRRVPLHVSFHTAWWRSGEGHITIAEAVDLAERWYPGISMESVLDNPFASVLFACADCA